ncbi:uncharacterized protein LOC144479184 [Mustelus asterias]
MQARGLTLLLGSGPEFLSLSLSPGGSTIGCNMSHFFFWIIMNEGMDVWKSLWNPELKFQEPQRFGHCSHWGKHGKFRLDSGHRRPWKCHTHLMLHYPLHLVPCAAKACQDFTCRGF